MKKLKSFFNSLFSDHGIMDRPNTDAQSIMYSFITFSDVSGNYKTNDKTKTDNVINFNDFKLRRA